MRYAAERARSRDARFNSASRARVASVLNRSRAGAGFLRKYVRSARFLPAYTPEYRRSFPITAHAACAGHPPHTLLALTSS